MVCRFANAAAVWMCCPASTVLANQASKALPDAKRAEIVQRREQEQRQEQCKASPKCPFLRLNADRAAANRLHRVEKQVASIQHRDWQEVDESEIN